MILSAFDPEGKPSVTENVSVPSARKSSWISTATGSVKLSPLNVISIAIALKSVLPIMIANYVNISFILHECLLVALKLFTDWLKNSDISTGVMVTVTGMAVSPLSTTIGEKLPSISLAK